MKALVSLWMVLQLTSLPPVMGQTSNLAGSTTPPLPETTSTRISTSAISNKHQHITQTEATTLKGLQTAPLTTRRSSVDSLFFIESHSEAVSGEITTSVDGIDNIVVSSQTRSDILQTSSDNIKPTYTDNSVFASALSSGHKDFESTNVLQTIFPTTVALKSVSVSSLKQVSSYFSGAHSILKSNTHSTTVSGIILPSVLQTSVAERDIHLSLSHTSNINIVNSESVDTPTTSKELSTSFDSLHSVSDILDSSAVVSYVSSRTAVSQTTDVYSDTVELGSRKTYSSITTDAASASFSDIVHNSKSSELVYTSYTSTTSSPQTNSDLLLSSAGRNQTRFTSDDSTVSFRGSTYSLPVIENLTSSLTVVSSGSSSSYVSLMRTLSSGEAIKSFSSISVIPTSAKATFDTSGHIVSSTYSKTSFKYSQSPSSQLDVLSSLQTASEIQDSVKLFVTSILTSSAYSYSATSPQYTYDVLATSSSVLVPMSSHVSSSIRTSQISQTDKVLSVSSAQTFSSTSIYNSEDFETHLIQPSPSLFGNTSEMSVQTILETSLTHSFSETIQQPGPTFSTSKSIQNSVITPSVTLSTLILSDVVATASLLFTKISSSAITDQITQLTQQTSMTILATLASSITTHEVVVPSTASLVNRTEVLPSAPLTYSDSAFQMLTSVTGTVKHSPIFSIQSSFSTTPSISDLMDRTSKVLRTDSTGIIPTTVQLSSSEISSVSYQTVSSDNASSFSTVLTSSKLNVSFISPSASLQITSLSDISDFSPSYVSSVQSNVFTDIAPRLSVTSTGSQLKTFKESVISTTLPGVQTAYSASLVTITPSISLQTTSEVFASNANMISGTSSGKSVVFTDQSLSTAIDTMNSLTKHVLKSTYAFSNILSRSSIASVSLASIFSSDIYTRSTSVTSMEFDTSYQVMSDVRSTSLIDPTPSTVVTNQRTEYSTPTHFNSASVEYSRTTDLLFTAPTPNVPLLSSSEDLFTKSSLLIVTDVYSSLTVDETIYSTSTESLPQQTFRTSVSAALDSHLVSPLSSIMHSFNTTDELSGMHTLESSVSLSRDILSSFTVHGTIYPTSTNDVPHNTLNISSSVTLNSDFITSSDLSVIPSFNFTKDLSTLSTSKFSLSLSDDIMNSHTVHETIYPTNTNTVPFETLKTSSFVISESDYLPSFGSANTDLTGLSSMSLSEDILSSPSVHVSVYPTSDIVPVTLRTSSYETLHSDFISSRGSIMAGLSASTNLASLPSSTINTASYTFLPTGFTSVHSPSSSHDAETSTSTAVLSSIASLISNAHTASINDSLPQSTIYFESDRASQQLSLTSTPSITQISTFNDLSSHSVLASSFTSSDFQTILSWSPASVATSSGPMLRTSYSLDGSFASTANTISSTSRVLGKSVVFTDKHLSTDIQTMSSLTSHAIPGTSMVFELLNQSSMANVSPTSILSSEIYTRSTIITSMRLDTTFQLISDLPSTDLIDPISSTVKANKITEYFTRVPFTLTSVETSFTTDLSFTSLLPNVVPKLSSSAYVSTKPLAYISYVSISSEFNSSPTVDESIYTTSTKSGLQETLRTYSSAALDNDLISPRSSFQVLPSGSHTFKSSVPLSVYSSRSPTVHGTIYPSNAVSDYTLDISSSVTLISDFISLRSSMIPSLTFTKKLSILQTYVSSSSEDVMKSLTLHETIYPTSTKNVPFETLNTRSLETLDTESLLSRLKTSVSTNMAPTPLSPTQSTHGFLSSPTVYESIYPTSDKTLTLETLRTSFSVALDNDLSSPRSNLMTSLTITKEPSGSQTLESSISLSTDTSSSPTAHGTIYPKGTSILSKYTLNISPSVTWHSDFISSLSSTMSSLDFTKEFSSAHSLISLSALSSAPTLYNTIYPSSTNNLPLKTMKTSSFVTIDSDSEHSRLSSSARTNMNLSIVSPMPSSEELVSSPAMHATIYPSKTKFLSQETLRTSFSSALGSVLSSLSVMLSFKITNEPSGLQTSSESSSRDFLSSLTAQETLRSESTVTPTLYFTNKLSSLQTSVSLSGESVHSLTVHENIFPTSTNTDSFATVTSNTFITLDTDSVHSRLISGFSASVEATVLSSMSLSDGILSSPTVHETVYQTSTKSLPQETSFSVVFDSDLSYSRSSETSSLNITNDPSDFQTYKSSVSLSSDNLSFLTVYETIYPTSTKTLPQETLRTSFSVAFDSDLVSPRSSVMPSFAQTFESSVTLSGDNLSSFTVHGTVYPTSTNGVPHITLNVSSSVTLNMNSLTLHGTIYPTSTNNLPFETLKTSSFVTLNSDSLRSKLMSSFSAYTTLTVPSFMSLSDTILTSHTLHSLIFPSSLYNVSPATLRTSSYVILSSDLISSPDSGMPILSANTNLPTLLPSTIDTTPFTFMPTGLTSPISTISALSSPSILISLFASSDLQTPVSRETASVLILSDSVERISYSLDSSLEITSSNSLKGHLTSTNAFTVSTAISSEKASVSSSRFPSALTSLTSKLERSTPFLSLTETISPVASSVHSAVSLSEYHVLTSSESQTMFSSLTGFVYTTKGISSRQEITPFTSLTEIISTSSLPYFTRASESHVISDKLTSFWSPTLSSSYSTVVYTTRETSSSYSRVETLSTTILDSVVATTFTMSIPTSASEPILLSPVDATSTISSLQLASTSIVLLPTSEMFFSEANLTSTSLNFVLTTPSLATTSRAVLDSVTGSFTIASTSISASTALVVPSTSVIPTTQAPPKVTTLNATTAEEPYWIRTVMKILLTINVTSDAFRADLEQRLAVAFNRAFIRLRLIKQGMFEPLRRRRRKKRFTTVGDASVHVIDVAREAGTSSVSAIYTVEKFGQLLTAAEAVAALDVLDTQEVAIILQQVLDIKAEPYLPVEPAQPDDEDSKMWLIGAIAGPVVAFLIFVWIVLCIYYKCPGRKRRKNSEPELMSIQQSPQKVTDLSKVQESKPPPGVELPPRGRKGGVGSKVRAYEIDQTPEPDIIPSEHKNNSRPASANSIQNGHIMKDTPLSSPMTSLVPPKPKRGRKSRRNSIEPMSEDYITNSVQNSPHPGRHGDKSWHSGHLDETSQLLQSSISDDNEELQQRARLERRRNKDRLREKRRKERGDDRRVAEFVTSQNHLNALGLASSSLPSVLVESGSTANGSKLSRHDSGVDNGNADENLEEARNRMHTLLDEAFSLITPRASMTESDIRNKGQVTMSSPPHKKKEAAKTDGRRSSKGSDPHDPERGKDIKHEPMFVNPAFSGSYSDFPLETWSPYRSFDQVALISMPQKPEPGPTRLGQKSEDLQTPPKSSKRPAANFDFTESKSASAIDDTKYTTSPPKPIVLRTKDAPSNQSGPAKANSSKSNGKFSATGINGDVYLTGSTTSLSAPKSKTSTDKMELKSFQNGTAKRHRAPSKDLRNSDEVDIINNLKPGETSGDLLQSLRDELSVLKESYKDPKPGKRRKSNAKSMTEIV